MATTSSSHSGSGDDTQVFAGIGKLGWVITGFTGIIAGLIGIIGGLLLYILNDTASEIQELQKSVNKLNGSVAGMEVKMETIGTGQDDLEKLIRIYSEEIKKEINNASSKSEVLEIKKLLEGRKNPR